MTIVRFARVAAIAAAGAFATAGAASAAPALNLAPGTTTNTAQSDATPVYYGYGPYGYNGYYAPPPRPYYRPYYNPYRSYYGNPGYYQQPYGYNGYNRYNGYRRPHSGLYIRTPGLRLGIGF